MLGLLIHLIGNHIIVDAHCMLCSIFVSVSSVIVAQAKELQCRVSSTIIQCIKLLLLAAYFELGH